MGDAERTHSKLVIRQPTEFRLNDAEQDFTTWVAQFSNFATAMKVKDDDLYVTLSSYLDTAAFTVVENLQLNDDQKKDPNVFKPLLENALRSETDKIPARLALRYRTQKQGESLSQFALELGKLATKSNVEPNTREQLLIDSFCTGIQDADTSIKLLENKFDTLTLALDHALKIEGASKIRNLVRPKHDEAPDVEILATGTIPQVQSPINTHSANTADVNAVKAQSTPSNITPNTFYQIPPFMPLGKPPRFIPPSNPQHFMTPSNPPRFMPQNNPQYFMPHNNPPYFMPNNQPAQYPNAYAPAQPYGSMHKNTPVNYHKDKSCYYCNIKGHIARNCRRRIKDAQQNFPQGPGTPQ